MIGLRTYLVGGAAALAVAATGVIFWQSGRIDRLKDANASLRASVAALEASRDQAREAARVADAHRAREAERAARLDSAIETLLTEDLNDADLVIDPRIGDLLDCLRRGATDPADCHDSSE